MKMYLNKGFKRILILLILVTGVLGSFTQGIVEGQVVSGPISYFEQSLNVMSGKASKIFNTLNGEVFQNNRKLGKRDAKATTDGMMVATIDAETRKLEIYKNMKDSPMATLEIDDLAHSYVLSWSPDNKFLIITEKGQSPSHQTSKLIKVSTKGLKEMMEFESYSTIMEWDNSILLFITSQDTCSDISCLPESFWLSRLDTETLNIDVTGKISELNINPPMFESIKIAPSEYKVNYSELDSNSTGIDLGASNYSKIIKK
jgi:hypothetical protein